MRIAGLMHARNEQWCIGLTARVALRWVDRLLVTAHACVDGTIDILERIRREAGADRVNICIEPNPKWNEMQQRQSALETARRIGATHVAIIDADEMLTANLLPEIRGMAEQTPRNQCLSLPGIHPFDGMTHYRTDGYFKQRLSLCFPDSQEYRWKPRGKLGYQFHCRIPPPLTQGFCPDMQGGIFHLQFARPRALRAKQAWYQAIELLNWPEFGAETIRRKYSWWLERTPELCAVPKRWTEGYNMDMLDLRDDQETWHERELKAMVQMYGKKHFAGLDFFGVV